MPSPRGASPPSTSSPASLRGGPPSSKGRGRPKGAFSQHRRIDRLVALLQRHPRGLSLYQLANELAVTPRSLRRYLEEVRKQVDLAPVRERGGGAVLWRLAPAELPRKIEVRRTQAYAMLAARALFEPIRGSTLYEEIGLFAERLLGVARRPGRGPNAGVADARLEERFVYVPFAPKDYSEKSQELDDIYQAVADLRPVRCVHARADGAEERVVLHPYAMLLYKDAVYFVAARDSSPGVKSADAASANVETFPLDRVSDTECLVDRRFTLPEGFDVRDYVQGQFGIWRGGEPTTVVIDFDVRVAEFLRSRRVHPSQRLDELESGGVRMTLTLGDLAEVANWVLGFGETARVLEPPELAARVVAELEGALARYR